MLQTKCSDKCMRKMYCASYWLVKLLLLSPKSEGVGYFWRNVCILWNSDFQLQYCHLFVLFTFQIKNTRCDTHRSHVGLYRLAAVSSFSVLNCVHSWNSWQHFELSACVAQIKSPWLCVLSFAMLWYLLRWLMMASVDLPLFVNNILWSVHHSLVGRQFNLTCCFS